MRLVRALKAFRRAESAIAAVEFALIMPLLVTLTTGAYEFSRAVNASRQLSNLSSSIANILATNASGTVTYVDLHYAYDSTLITFSQVLSDAAAKGLAWGSDITVSMAGISFTPVVAGCTSGCTYKANVVWTGAGKTRTCGSTIASAPDTATPTPTTLPADLFTPAANPQGGNSPPNFAIVVDVTFSWTPLIYKNLIGGVTMKKSAFLTPRYTTAIKYSAISGDDGFGNECPGF